MISYPLITYALTQANAGQLNITAYIRRRGGVSEHMDDRLANKQSESVGIRATISYILVSLDAHLFISTSTFPSLHFYFYLPIHMSVFTDSRKRELVHT
jgi:hypothetical protein